MIPLIAFIILAIVVLVLTEVHERRKQAQPKPDAETRPADGECCGAHLVCERETLLQPNAKPEYYDDEELDALADIDVSSYSDGQHDAIRQVFDSLREEDVPGWCRSMQLRHIALPDDIRDEALLIVRERRAAAKQ